ncbi:MFS transporter [Burkholderia multivorans]|uniref:MFS transporter n=1 Tax=Burkholderia multivorans TaxID=87883 RepID=UPI000757D2B4|nr:MFS transporter [Burkholderia multivorans]KVP27855.1 MFS transporter [Burkholderia multivorans]
MSPIEQDARRCWLPVLAGGLIMGAALGIRHVQGLFLAPVTLDHGWSREAFGLALALQNLIWGIAQPFTGMVADRFGSVRVIVVGMLLYALGLVTMALAGSAALFTVGAGLVIGIALSGSAFASVYGALSRLCAPERRSWALGVAGAIGGLGQFCMVPVAQTLIGGIGWQHAFVALALVALLLAPLAVLLRDRPAQAANAQADAEQSIGEAVREAFSHRGFWLLNAGFFACGFQLAFIATHLPAYLLDHGLPSRHASVALALIALTNVVGTYACGHLGGLLRRKYVLSVLYLVRAFAMAAFVAVPLSPASVYVFAAVMGLTWLGTVPLTNGVISQVFGVRYIATLFGFVFFGHQLGSFFGVWLGAVVYDATHSYLPLWIGSIALGVLAALLHLPIDDARIARPLGGRAAWA